MDKKLFLIMYGFSQKRKGMNRFWLFVANHSSHIFFSVYAITIIWLLWKNPGKLVPVILIPFFTFLATKWLRAALRRQRPFTTFNLPVVTKHPKAYSCPSNHAASSMIIALACLCVNGSLGIVLLISAVFTGMSRIFVGLHYPADVAAGWILAAGFGALFIFI